MEIRKVIPKVFAQRMLFFIQITLLLLIALVFILDYTNEMREAGSFYYAMILGALGASIALNRRIGKEDIKVMKQISEDKLFSMLMPVIYGILMAGVAYLLFMSGLLSGKDGTLISTPIFPFFEGPEDLSMPLVEQFISLRPASMIEAAKLLIWCFIAGYSEHFVTGLLDTLETRGNSNEDE